MKQHDMSVCRECGRPSKLGDGICGVRCLRRLGLMRQSVRPTPPASRPQLAPLAPRGWWDDPGPRAAMEERELRFAPRVEDLRAWYVARGWITPESLRETA